MKLRSSCLQVGELQRISLPVVVAAVLDQECLEIAQVVNRWQSLA